MKILACLVLAACALTSRSAPRELRYFTTEPIERGTPREAIGPRLQLRVGRITATANLRYAIVHRESAVEVEPYETLRWTEMPDSYVRRAVLHALFDERPLAQAVSGDAPSLEVEVLAFEEAARGASHGGRVTLRYELRDDRAVIARGTVTSERAAATPAIEAVVPAIRAAMLAASEELADRVEHALRDRAAPARDERYAPVPAQSPEGSPAGARAPALH